MELVGINIRSWLYSGESCLEDMVLGWRRRLFATAQTVCRRRIRRLPWDRGVSR